MKATIKLGFAPTRRAIFSAPAAVEYRNLTAARLRELGIDFVDIDDINEEGLLYDDAGLERTIEKFQTEKVDGLFIPHANFGTEYECARLARALNVPVLLWGPRDERPDENGMRLRDSQCGLFATGKVLRRFLWHDRIHAKALYRLAVRLGGTPIPDPFHWADPLA